MTDISNISKPKKFTFMDISREVYRAVSFAIFAWVVPWFFAGSFKGTPIYWSAWIILLFSLYPVIIILFAWNYFMRVPDAWHWQPTGNDKESNDIKGNPDRFISWLAAYSFAGTAIIMDFLYLGLLRGSGLGYFNYGFPYIIINYAEMLILPPLVNRFQGRILIWWELRKGTV